MNVYPRSNELILRSCSSGRTYIGLNFERKGTEATVCIAGSGIFSVGEEFECLPRGGGQASRFVAAIQGIQDFGVTLQICRGEIETMVERAPRVAALGYFGTLTATDGAKFDFRAINVSKTGLLVESTGVFQLMESLGISFTLRDKPLDFTGTIARFEILPDEKVVRYGISIVCMDRLARGRWITFFNEQVERGRRV